ncbi:TetR/AcrR family transcriptional regulator [Caulobacter sp.]|uniref:TetR/AcrR family transcriptional regulator n=1 Tax=Caulobacter sp. TaxID=78 RepID=UPI001B1A4881|nr:TetR/AcrR family transcriptional regulator [Caulobacter sp.]MBO9547565.1 TetR/AcrR family transcriptional regulator [Caulobacter sp.]
MSTSQPRRRLTREDRLQQLLATSWTIIREEGTDALTLGRLAERAGVTKPVVYDHFGTRDGLLIALYEAHDAVQNAAMDTALAGAEATLEARARLIAGAYVDCVLKQGREIPGVLAALAGSPALEAAKHAYLSSFLETCRALLAPFAPSGTVSTARLWAMLGAAETLSRVAAAGEITPDEAKAELFRAIVAVI